jgi:hypothetical protein
MFARSTGSITMTIRAAAIVMFVAVASVAGWLTGAGSESRNPPWAVTLEGLGRQYDTRLGLYKNDVGFDPPASPAVQTARIYSVAARVAPVSSSPAAGTLAFNTAGRQYFWEVAKLFPADFLARWLASIATTFSTPPIGGDVPARLLRPTQSRVVRALAVGLAMMRWTTVPFATLVILGISTVNLRLAIWTLFCAAYLASSLPAQRQTAEIVGAGLIQIWPAVVLLQWTFSACRVRFGPRDQDAALAVPPAPIRSLGSVVSCFAALAVGTLFVAGGSLLIAREYQTQRVGRLIHAYVAAPRESLPLVRTTVEDAHLVLVSFPDLIRMLREKRGQIGTAATELLAVEFDSEKCDFPGFDMAIRYRAQPGAPDPSETIPVRLGQLLEPNTVVYVPVYSLSVPSPGTAGTTASADMTGLELPESTALCLTQVSRVRDVEKVPLLLTVQSGSGSERLKRYDTFTRWEAAARPQGVQVFRAPPHAVIRREMWTSPLKNLDNRSIVLEEPVVHGTGETIMLDGTPRTQDAFLFQTATQPLKRGDNLIVQGRLHRGGVTIGLLNKSGNWAAYVNVIETGEFLSVVQTTEDGEYSVVIANCATGPTLDVSASFNRFGFLPRP